MMMKYLDSAHILEAEASQESIIFFFFHSGFFLNFFQEDKINYIKAEKNVVAVNITVNITKHYAKRHWKPARAFSFFFQQECGANAQLFFSCLSEIKDYIIRP